MVKKFWGRDMFLSDAQTITIPVSLDGKIGSATLTRRFRVTWPELIEDFRNRLNGSLKPPYVFSKARPQVLVFPTKMTWREKPDKELIKSGLDHISGNYLKMGIETLALPALGCGPGELKWDDVYTMIQECLGAVSLPVYVYKD